MRHRTQNQTRLVTRIIRDVLHGEPFETLADLTDAVKARCARLRVDVTPDDLNAAYALIVSNTPLVVDPETIRRTLREMSL